MNSTKKHLTQKLKHEKIQILDKKTQSKVKGGFLFWMIDQSFCNIERFASILSGGNGDGDW